MTKTGKELPRRDSLCIPTMSITQSDLMSISCEPSDAGLSQSETVIGMSQGDLPFRDRFLLLDGPIGTVPVLAGVAPAGYPEPMRRTGSEAMAEMKPSDPGGFCFATHCFGEVRSEALDHQREVSRAAFARLPY